MDVGATAQVSLACLRRQGALALWTEARVIETPVFYCANSESLSPEWRLGERVESPRFGCTCPELRLSNKYLGAAWAMLITPCPPRKIAFQLGAKEGQNHVFLAVPVWSGVLISLNQVCGGRVWVLVQIPDTLAVLWSFTKYFWVNVSSFAVYP